jgi:hypothetical protein
MRILPPKFPPRSTADGVPAGYTTAVQRSFEITGNMHGRCRVRFCEPFGEIVTPPNTVVQPPYAGLSMTASLNGTSTTTNDLIMQLALGSVRFPFITNSGLTVGTPSYYQGMAFPNATFGSNIGVNFGKYRNTGRLRLHYRPLVSTTDNSDFIIALSADGAHPVVGLSQSQLSVPTFTTLDNGCNSLQFVAWQPWSIEWEVDNTEKFTHRYPYYQSGGTFLTIPWYEADTRASTFAGMTVLSNGTSGSSITVVKGQLYWETEFEYSDPWPVASGSVYLSAVNSIMRSRDLTRRGAADAVDTADDVKSPPAAVSMPVSSAHTEAATPRPSFGPVPIATSSAFAAHGRIMVDPDDDDICPTPPRKVASVKKGAAAASGAPTK